ncbi:spore coat protein CotJB [Baia soyae]|uniref:Spore coat protein JB n=1 Tax=Baia soyae TaxID=1544746 RepID=A0A4R2SEW8_9BACL|nr:spore coat protein CotJB [Baia soyae]TCP69722.1 spore coat protein JB [Baia soyae]
MNTPLPPEYYELLEELQAVDFALVELTLYLDTHPKDMDSIRQFNGLAKKRKKLAKEYEARYGPLLQFGRSYSDEDWSWGKAPWPWQV